MTSYNPRRHMLKEHVATPLILLTTVYVAGSMGYKLLNWEEWSFLDCAYMTAITLTTVGYGDVLGIDDYPMAKIYTMVLMLMGMGVVVYAVSTLTAFVVEGKMMAVFAESHMQRKIMKLKNHYIICGSGATGHYVVDEFYKLGESFVVIDMDINHIKELRNKYDEILCFDGDANEEANLHRANIDHAKGIIALLASDKDNLFLVVTARAMNPNLMIAARATDSGFIRKLRNVGAQVIVSPNAVGGMRIASEILRPNVVSFLDAMLRSPSTVTRFGEVIIPAGSHLVNRLLKDSYIYQETGLTVIAIKPANSNEFIYNPTADTHIDAGSVLIVIGTPQQVQKLEKIVVS